MVKLVPAREADRHALRAALSDYLIEFAEMQGRAVERDEDDQPAYPWFDRYWRDVDRLPFVFRESGRIVGFSLVRVMNGGWNIAEFGVRPELRRRGYGRRAADALVKAARRTDNATHLRADVHVWNRRALAFWTACGFVPIAERDDVIRTEYQLDHPAP